MSGVVVFSRGRLRDSVPEDSEMIWKDRGPGFGVCWDFEVGASSKKAKELGYLWGRGGCEDLWGFRKDRSFPGTQGP